MASFWLWMFRAYSMIRMSCSGDAVLLGWKVGKGSWLIDRSVFGMSFLISLIRLQCAMMSVDTGSRHLASSSVWAAALSFAYFFSDSFSSCSIWVIRLAKRVWSSRVLGIGFLGGEIYLFSFSSSVSIISLR